MNCFYPTILFVGLLSGCTKQSPEQEALLVFAAASTAEAVTEVAALFEQQTGRFVKVHSAGSSTLARQIEAGVKAQVYLSANPQWMDYLQERALLQETSRRTLLSNRLVLIRPRRVGESSVETKANLTEIMAGIRGRLAMADPDHVPAGRYARQVLQSLCCCEQTTGFRTRMFVS